MFVSDEREKYERLAEGQAEGDVQQRRRWAGLLWPADVTAREVPGNDSMFLLYPQYFWSPNGRGWGFSTKQFSDTSWVSHNLTQF